MRHHSVRNAVLVPCIVCLALSTTLSAGVLGAGGPLTQSTVDQCLHPATIQHVAEGAQQGGDQRGQFAPSVFRDVGGEVAVEDGEVRVVGTATGLEEVLVTMIDERGQIASEIVIIDNDDVFDEDVPLLTADGRDLSEGLIVGAVFHPGRDGVVGDGEIGGVTRADLEALDEETRDQLARELQNRSIRRTQQQVLELFYDESIADAGSDDLALVDAFVYTDGRTSIATVGPVANETAANATAANETAGPIVPVSAGEPMIVRGTTNRKPDDTTIAVEAIDGPAPEDLEVVVTDTWGLDGVWEVTIDTAGVEPGTYTLRADDGDDTDTVEVVISPSRNQTVTDPGVNSSLPSPATTSEGADRGSSLRSERAPARACAGPVAGTTAVQGSDRS